MITNPGFEADPVAPGKYNDAIVPTGWVIYDPDKIIGQDYNSIGVLNPAGTTLYPGGAPEGSNVALIFLWRMQTDGIAAGIAQELSHSLLSNTKYTLRAANRPRCPPFVSPSFARLPACASAPPWRALAPS
jgi:hypothetical protein